MVKMVKILNVWGCADLLWLCQEFVVKLIPHPEIAYSYIFEHLLPVIRSSSMSSNTATANLSNDHPFW